MHDEQRSYSIAISHTLLSSAVLLRLVKVLGNPKAVWTASEAQLKEHLDEKQIQKLLSARTQHSPEQLLASYQKMGIQALSQSDPAYPTLLKCIHDPPFLVYARGNLALLPQKMLAVVGTRRYTDYGQRVVSALIEQLAPHGPGIISGLAAGIDTLAHRSALIHHLPTVAVFGTGIDRIYPQDNEQLALDILKADGVLLSEYPMGMPASKFTFPRRNRIIAGMSQGTLVVEGSLKSGALITAREALEENRQVLAVPGNIFSPTSHGPNRLIQEGAVPVQSGEDIVQALGWETASVPLVNQTAPVGGKFSEVIRNLSNKETEILMSVGYEPTSFEAIQSQKRELSIMELQSSLTMLELYGLVSALPGARFCRN
jgi:DNA processing protein